MRDRKKERGLTRVIDEFTQIKSWGGVNDG